MPIKVKCGSCSAAFSAKDGLAGKTVKCPKCSAPLRVPTAAAQNASSVQGAAPVAAASGRRAGTVAGNLGDPLADLLDEVGVKGAVTGPSCPSCEALITPGARLCINCGYNFETGTQMQTIAYDDEADEMAGMTETEKMLWKAEREIEDMPISGVGEDFGDGASAYVVAGGVALVAVTLAAVGLLVTMALQDMADSQGSAKMALAAAGIFFGIGHIWMIIAAFVKEPRLGVMAVFIPGFTFVYACMYRVWFAVFMMAVGALVFSGAWAYLSSQ